MVLPLGGSETTAFVVEGAPFAAPDIVDGRRYWVSRLGKMIRDINLASKSPTVNGVHSPTAVVRRFGVVCPALDDGVGPHSLRLFRCLCLDTSIPFFR